jgi:ABC-type lipoprotein export system ATPase subunit
VLFVVGGSGSVSSASLSVLKHLKNKCKINVLYVKPDMSFLSPLKQKLERMVYNVFQEYARSGLFERLYIVSNSELENIIGGVPVKLYNEKINEILVHSMFFRLEQESQLLELLHQKKM